MHTSTSASIFTLASEIIYSGAACPQMISSHTWHQVLDLRPLHASFFCCTVGDLNHKLMLFPQPPYSLAAVLPAAEWRGRCAPFQAQPR
eukprot:363937-Chlamydomonas_euryale.AAC.6